MYKRILIATDFSRHAHYALRRAIEFAQMTHADITCLHVLNQDWIDQFNVFKNQSEANVVQNYAHEAHHQSIRNLPINYPVNFLTLIGRAPDQIIDYIKTHDIDYVFIGAHGTHYLNDYILGTNSQSVIKQVHVPIQIIKNEPDFVYQRILVATDFSETSKKSIEIAYQLYPDAQFMLLHVTDVWYEQLPGDIQHHLHREMNASLQKKLAMFLNTCNVDPHRFLLKFVGGYPADDIVKEAVLWDAQLIVTGTRSHSLLHYILLGRVTDRLLRINPTDMLIVPPTP